jgi:hypothetical protein
LIGWFDDNTDDAVLLLSLQKQERTKRGTTKASFLAETRNNKWNDESFGDSTNGSIKPPGLSSVYGVIVLEGHSSTGTIDSENIAVQRLLADDNNLSIYPFKRKACYGSESFFEDRKFVVTSLSIGKGIYKERSIVYVVKFAVLLRRSKSKIMSPW